jgi:phytoene synthase
MDLTVTRYPTYADLLDYMEGSAAVIGAMMLPVLGAADPAAAAGPARELGRAFQLTNFIRDIGEDFRRGRIYLPTEDLDAYGVTPAALGDAVAAGAATPAIRALVAHAIRRAEAHYEAAEIGIGLLEPASRACIATAYRLYREILVEIARADCDPLRRRAVVPRRRRLAIVARCLVPALAGGNFSGRGR